MRNCSHHFYVNGFFSIRMGFPPPQREELKRAILNISIGLNLTRQLYKHEF